MGELFAARGAGYFLGIVLSGLVLKLNIPITKEQYLMLSILVLGISSLQTTCSSFRSMAVEVFITGVATGGFDTNCNIILPELWGPRVQPW